MQEFAVIALIVIVGGFAISWVIRRFLSERAGVVISILTDILARTVATVFLFAVSVRLAERGGAALAFGIALGIFSLAMTVLIGIRVGALWYVTAHGIPEE